MSLTTHRQQRCRMGRALEFRYWMRWRVNIRNNTIISNDTPASSGVLFNTLGRSLASSQDRLR